MQPKFKLELTAYELGCIELYLLDNGGQSKQAHNRILNKIDRARRINGQDHR